LPREKIKCSLEEYCNIIREEFSKITITEDQSKLKINHRGRVPMSISQIEEGIRLGKELLEKRIISKNM